MIAGVKPKTWRIVDRVKIFLCTFADAAARCCRLLNKFQDMKIAIIGCGAMGGALAEGFVRSTAFGAAGITVTARHGQTLVRFRQLGVNATTDNVEAVRGADIVVLAVKPWLVKGVADELKPVLDCARQTVVSVAAGVSGSELTDMFTREDGSCPKIFIAMPNIAAALGCSMTFIVNVNGGEEDAGMTENVFRAVGETMLIEERLLPAGTALASCGIAYAMRYVRASMEGGVQLGFKAGAARDIVLQTVKGAVALLQDSGGHPEAEIDKVTTPGGLTIRGLNAMERAGFTNAVVCGLVDCK